ncbi:MAG: hypothetical protein QOE70_4303 [Chthoniobacter sp.]|jgi:hypothetical protein|nr:hypothetical protein [Chthoniobacter sp.]
MTLAGSGWAQGVEPKLAEEPPPVRSWDSPSGLWLRKTTVIAGRLSTCGAHSASAKSLITYPKGSATRARRSV